MLHQHTITQLQALSLDGMAIGLQEQFTQRMSDEPSFEGCLGLLVDGELTYRDNKKQARLLKSAKLKVSTTCLENVGYRPGRGLDKKQVASFASCDWMRVAQSILLTGPPARVGKNWASQRPRIANVPSWLLGA